MTVKAYIIMLAIVLACPLAAPAWPPNWVGGVHVLYPQKWSASIAYLFPIVQDDNNPVGWRGGILQLTPGFGGGKVAVGLAWVDTSRNLCTAKLSLIQTWGDPWGVEPDQTYVGLEFEYAPGKSQYPVALTIGVHARVAGDELKNDVIVTGGLGFGF